jgi:hypothetical protein
MFYASRTDREAGMSGMGWASWSVVISGSVVVGLGILRLLWVLTVGKDDAVFDQGFVAAMTVFTGSVVWARANDNSAN